MLKGLFRLALIAVILIGVGGFFLGWWGSDHVPRSAEEIGTTGTEVAREAREATDELGGRAESAANQARVALEDGALTAKIKSKMALDDIVKASEIDVDTRNNVVTLTGTVSSQAARERAVRLARETEGVKQVVDKLEIGR